MWTILKIWWEKNLLIKNLLMITIINKFKRKCKKIKIKTFCTSSLPCNFNCWKHPSGSGHSTQESATSFSKQVESVGTSVSVSFGVFCGVEGVFCVMSCIVELVDDWTATVGFLPSGPTSKIWGISQGFTLTRGGNFSRHLVPNLSLRAWWHLSKVKSYQAQNFINNSLTVF